VGQAFVEMLRYMADKGLPEMRDDCEFRIAVGLRPGIDISAARLARARRLAREQDLRNVSFVQADAQADRSAGRAHVLVDGTEDGVWPTVPRGLRVRLPRSGLVHPPEIAPRVLDTGKRQ
jgi:hypothetical protein